MAVDCAQNAFATENFSRTVLVKYEARRESEFGKKFLLCRLLQHLIANRYLCKSTVSLLDRRPDLADALVGVIGDYLPPGKVVSPVFALKLVSGFLGGGNSGKNIRPNGKNKTPEMEKSPALTNTSL